MTDPSLIPADYAPLLAEIKARVRRAQTRAVLAVNAELIRLYWEIGGMIHERQLQEGWGAAVIPRLARDLHNELPDEKGFSERNIKRMLAFHRAYPQANFVPQAVAPMESDAKMPQAAALFPAELLQALPWGHHAELMAKVKEPSTRQWYMRAAVEHGWSRSILVMQIESAAHQRQGITTSNFAQRLPAPESELVQQTLKDPYIFDFLTLADDFHERELRHANDTPTIGLILCQQPNRVLAEYALRGIDKPIGVSTYELTRALPAELQTSLPSIESIEQALADEAGGAEA
jgi:predicted nuclease of restriction endonuclease-like (RecB) superfamily